MVEDYLYGIGITRVRSFEMLGDGADMHAGLLVFMQHNSNRTSFPGNAGLLHAWEKVILLPAVMTLVGEALKKLDEWLKDAPMNFAGLDGLGQSGFETIEYLKNQLVLFAQATGRIHIAAPFSQSAGDSFMRSLSVAGFPLTGVDQDIDPAHILGA